MTGQEIFRAAGGLFTEVWHQEDIGGMLNDLGLRGPGHPHLDAAMRDIGSPNGAGTFEYGLHLIIDGIRAALRSHPTSMNAGQAASHARAAAV